MSYVNYVSYVSYVSYVTLCYVMLRYVTLCELCAPLLIFFQLSFTYKADQCELHKQIHMCTQTTRIVTKWRQINLH